MVDEGKHLWNCIKYIDLNMVRAGVVPHPSQWGWCGYAELMGERQRYRLLDVKQMLKWCGADSLEGFRDNYRYVISEAVEKHELAREPWWTESIAVGRESFVRGIEELTTRRREMLVEETTPSHWTLREAGVAYNAFSRPKSEPNPSEELPTNRQPVDRELLTVVRPH